MQPDVIDRPTSLMLGGVERKFRFTFGSFELLAARYENVEAPFSILVRWLVDKTPLSKEVTASLVDCVHAGLRPDDKKITRDEVADLIDRDNAGVCVLTILKARTGSLPDPKKESEAEDPQ